ncbi:DUF1294 domain-containing protein [Anaeromicrobium sediminis]|uniref:DUF1294 domain-containing protein n=1 Tax=Anaeromicrobium sediminis TaxID=1478221 RepID=A0A267MMN8_9FIRM|nr:hypothetical protein CCE28_04535 [Anaeromicrobium sediminis]
MKNVIILYLLSINILAFLIMGIDKHKAKKNKWRIQEKTLFIYSLIGGVYGIFLGMKIFHHKTRKKKFSIGIPFILIINVLCIIYLIKIS